MSYMKVIFVKNIKLNKYSIYTLSTDYSKIIVIGYFVLKLQL